MGSTRVARRAGKKLEAAPTSVSRPMMPANTAGSVALTSYSMTPSTRVKARAPTTPTAMPRATSRARERAPPKHRVAARAERQPDAELPGALDHRVRHHAVETHCRQYQREGGEACQQRHAEAPPRQGVAEIALERPNVRDGEIRVKGLHRHPGARGERAQVAVGAHDEVHAAPGELRHRPVDGGLRERVDAGMLHVAHDADDRGHQGIVPGHEDSLPEGRLIGEVVAGESLAHHHRLRVAGVVGRFDAATLHVA